MNKPGNDARNGGGPAREEALLRMLTAQTRSLQSMNSLPEALQALVRTLPGAMFHAAAVVDITDAYPPWLAAGCDVDDALLCGVWRRVRETFYCIAGKALPAALPGPVCRQPQWAPGADVRQMSVLPVGGKKDKPEALLILFPGRGRSISSCEHMILRHAVEHTAALVEASGALRKAALEDALTGLANRRCLLAQASTLLSLTRRRHASIAFIMLDMDGLKHTNDRHGHAVGDAVLVEAGRRLLRSTRRADVVARYGGDEFALVLPWIEMHNMHDYGRRIQEALSGKPLDVRNVRCTLSACAGAVCALPCDLAPHPPEAWLAAADRALYAAKERGPGCFFCLPSDATGL